jgi:hypothetical protein
MDPTSNSSALAASRPGEARPAAPWWRFGMVWLVLAGPALSVVAGFTILALAYRHPDAVVVQAPARGTAPLAGPTVPALQGRNHAATPPRAPAEP